MRLILICFISLLYSIQSQALVKDAAKYINKKFFSSYGIDIDKLNIKWESKSLLEKRIVISQENLCLNITHVKNCIQQFKLELDFKIPNILDFKINKIVLKTPQLVLRPKPKNNEKSEGLNISENLQMVKKWLSSETLNLIDISIQSLEFYDGEKLTKFSIELKTNKSGRNSDGFIEMETPEIKLKSKIALEFHKKLTLTMDSELTLAEISGSFIAVLHLRNSEAEIQIKDIDAKISNQYRVLSTGCFARFSYQANIPLECEKISLELHQKRSFFYDLNLNAKINNIINFTRDREIVYVKVLGRQSQNSAYDLDLKTELSIHTKDNKVSNTIEEFKLNFVVSEFKDFVRDFEDSPFAIPAPFNSLAGSINITSSFNQKKNILIFPIEGRVDLGKNENTKLIAKLESLVRLKDDFTLKGIELDLEIEKLVFHTPYIDPIYGIPKISSSDEISEKVKLHKKEPLEFDVDVKISTSSNQSIVIYNELFSPNLTLGFKSEILNEESQFELDFAPGSQIVYLKRVVEIKSINLKDKQKESLIDAKFEYETSGYLIKFDVVGTVESPRLILTSFPSLPRDEIISLLIYNRKSSELSSLDRSSVGSTQDAISNRALGLFSIWAFASTPIESVSYNPESKTYSAVVSLPGNTSVDIGTTGESVSSLSFRKRISESWAVVTTFEPNEEDSKESVLLQKEINF